MAGFGDWQWFLLRWHSYMLAESDYLEKEPFLSAISATHWRRFANQYPGRDYTIEIVCPEFTSVCPKTGQPDFGTLRSPTRPTQMRGAEEPEAVSAAVPQRGHFLRGVTNRILDDLVAVLAPRK